MVKFWIIIAVATMTIFNISSLRAKEKLPVSIKNTTNPILTLPTVLTRVEEAHPLLKGSQTERMNANGKLLKALGKFDPNIVNDFELERLAKGGAAKTLGFNDTFVEMRHPSGIKGFVGFRAGIGDVEIADLAIGNSNTPLLGIAIPLLRGLFTNPANAELKKSSLAGKEAQLQIQQTRQDLYLGAATQYWNWVKAWWFMELQKNAVSVADDRLSQLTKQVEAGARAPFEAIEGEQEVERRRDELIKSLRMLDEEQIKLSLYLWEEDQMDVPINYIAPRFPPAQKIYSRRYLYDAKKQAATTRPELKLVDLEAEFNNIDLKVAENNLLPDLSLEVEPTRKAGEFVLGVGYRFGIQFRIPLYRREARGDVIQKEAKAKRLRLLQRYSQKKVTMDVENAHSAINRAMQRMETTQKALRLAQKLEDGERARFKLGATSLLIVNLRERNVLRAAKRWISANADYQKARALYNWSSGEWTNGHYPISTKMKKRKDHKLS